MPCGSEMPATTVSLRSFAAAGIWLASLAGVIPSFKMSSAMATEENATAPPSNAIFRASANRVCLLFNPCSSLDKSAPSSKNCVKYLQIMTKDKRRTAPCLTPKSYGL